MLFKDVKQNYPVYILDRQEMKCSQGKVMQNPFPRVEMNQKTGKVETVVDLLIETGGKTNTYVIPENLSVTYAGDLILSTDKLGLTNEIEVMRNTAEQVLNSVDRQKQVLAKADELLAELNPVFKEKQETEKRFSSIEGAVTDMKSSIGELKGLVEDFIKKLS